MRSPTLALLIALLTACCVTQMHADVTEQWVARFDGPDSYFDDAKAIAVDDSGFVYVTGEVLRDSSRDLATLKYAPNGQQRWVAYFDGQAGGTEEASDIAVDSLGNVYVVGTSEAAPYDDEFVTIKYNWAGHEEWVSRFNDTAGNHDGGRAIAVDDSGYIYVTGYGVVSGSGQDWTTIRYDADGDSLWVSRYNGPNNWDDWSLDIAVDDSGHVYVTGSSGGIGTCHDCCTIKYGPSGNELWVSTYSGGAGNDVMRAIAIGGNGDVSATGYSDGGASEYDYVTIKYGPRGRSRWVARYDGPASDWDYPTAICVDDSGNVYVTGYSQGGETGNDCATIKYGPSGAERWVTRYDGPESGPDAAYSIALDADGNIYVAGTCENVGHAAYRDYLTIQYSPSGDEQWVQTYTGPLSHGTDIAWAMTVDDTANVYVTGTSRGETTYDDYATIKYSPEVPVEGAFYAVLGESELITLRWTVASLAGIEGFNVYRAASETGPFTLLNEDLLPPASPGCFHDRTAWPETTFWYELRAVLADGSEDIVRPSPISATTPGRLTARLYPARPNPFRGETILWLDVPSHVGPVSLAIYDVAGRQMASLLSGPVDRGRQCIRWDGTTGRGSALPSGVYFARLEVGGEARTEKLALIR